MATVRPFQFTGLPRLTREQIALEASLASCFSAPLFEPEFVGGVAAMLERYLKVPCKLGRPERRIVARADLPSILPATGCMVVVGAGGNTHKVLLDIDLGTACFAIERLLGGSGESDRIQRALTEIEEGVLSFLLLKVLSHFHDGMKSGRELGLTLDRFGNKLDDLAPVIEAQNDYVMLAVRLGIGKHVGHARIFLPAGLVSERFGKPVSQGGGSPEDHAYMLQRLQSVGDTLVSGRVEMATLDLSPEDRQSLEVGDIIIIEDHQVHKTPDGIEGLVFIKLGTGRNGGIRGRLLGGEQHRVEVVEIVVQEEPQEEVMTDEEGANLAETEGLLRDVAAPVVVELGRIRMNTAQVVRLKKGQILRLPRTPNDPVDLVVNGKLFARGELIEVDGELGIRLIQVVGAG